MAERRTDEPSAARAADGPAADEPQRHSFFGRPRTGKDQPARPAGRIREVSAATRTDNPVVPPAGRRPPRQAELRLTHVDPWSVTKMAFVLSIVLGVVSVVAVFIVWTVLGAAGLWDAINSATAQTLGETEGQTFQIQDYVGTGRAVGFTMIVAVVDVVLLTMIATLGAFLYNLAASLLGGVEVTLAEDE